MSVKSQFKTNPFRIDRVDTPFGPSLPDIPELNAKAFSAVEKEIEQVRNSEDRQSRGVLILGEAGTGKTHLLSQLHHRLGGSNHLLFVPRPANATGVTSFIWTKILESLNQIKDLDLKLNQLDLLLQEAFSNLVLESANTDEKLAKSTKKDWERLALKIMNDEGLGEEAGKVKTRVLDFWRKTHGMNALQIQFVQGLFQFLNYKDRQKKLQVFHWLATYDCDLEVANEIGLPKWESVQDDSHHMDVTQRREEWALEAIKVISELSNYAKPLILAFDQLEGLRGKIELTRAWGDSVREIMTHCRNVVVVCCIFPSLWKDWFTKRLEDGLCPLEDAVTDRINGRKIELEPLNLDIAKKLISSRLSSGKQSNRGAESLGPFDVDQVSELFSSMERSSVRTFLKKCYERFEELNAGDQSNQDAKAFGDPIGYIQTNVDQAKPTTSILDESEIVSRLKELLEEVHPSLKITVNSLVGTSQVILPDHILVTDNSKLDNRTKVIGICNKQGKAMTTRLGNWLAQERRFPDHEFVLIRSRNAKNPAASAVGAGHLREMASRLRYLSSQEELKLNSLFSTLVAIQEREIETPQGIVTIEHFRDYMRSDGHKHLNPVYDVNATSLPARAEPVVMSRKPVGKPRIAIPKESSPDIYTPAPNIKEAQVPRFEPKGAEVEENMRMLAKFVQDFRLPIRQTDLNYDSDVSIAPHVLSFHLQMSPGQSVDKVLRCDRDAALHFKRSVRVYANQDLGRVTFEIQRAVRAPWHLSQMVELMGTPDPSGVSIPIGVNSLGQLRTQNMFGSSAHLLVGGSSGSGKSNFLLCLLGAILLRYSDQHVKISIADVKMVDFESIRQLRPPHLASYATEPSSVRDLLEYYCELMDARYQELQRNKMRKWHEMRAIESDKNPFHILLIDEVADLFSNKKDSVIDNVKRLAQKARAAGIELILCSQHPKADIIDAQITANLNNRIAFKLQTHYQSKVILDQSGAEDLLGQGDCLFRSENKALERIQVPYYDQPFETLLESQFAAYHKKSAA